MKFLRSSRGTDQELKLDGTRLQNSSFRPARSNIRQHLERRFLVHIHRNQEVGGGPRLVVSTAAFHAKVRGSVPGLVGLKETKMFLPHLCVKLSIVRCLRDREVACSASDRQGSNFESCVWRTVSSYSSHHPQEVLLAQFSLYVQKGGLKPDSFHYTCNQGVNNIFCICHVTRKCAMIGW